MVIAGGVISGGTILGPLGEVAVTELPVHFDILPPGSPLPVGGEEWVPGDTFPLKRVVRHTEGAASATVALVTAEGQSFEVLHPDAATVRREMSLDFGDASRASARTWARRYLDVAADARRGITVELIPNVGPVPYLDFGIGDNISVLGEAHRVVGIGMKVGADSITQWTLDLDQPRMLLEERLAAIMRRFLPGGAGGRTILPTPTQPTFPSNQVASEKEQTWSAPVQGTYVLTKNGTPITGASLSATGVVTLTDAAREYVKGTDQIDFTIDGANGFDAPWTPTDGRWLQEFRVTEGDIGVTITASFV